MSSTHSQNLRLHEFTERHTFHAVLRAEACELRVPSLVKVTRHQHALGENIGKRNGHHGGCVLPLKIRLGKFREFVVHFDYGELKDLLRTDGPAQLLPR